MDTIKLYESLYYKFCNNTFYNVMRVCRIITDEQNIVPKQYLEYNSYIEEFSNPCIICCSNFTINVIMISRKKKNKLYPIFNTNGNSTQLMYVSKSALFKMITDFFKIKDYIPNPMFKQIFWIDSIENTNIISDVVINDQILLNNINNQNNHNYLDMVPFTEINTNQWTISPNFSNISNIKLVKTNCNTIIKNILKEV